MKQLFLFIATIITMQSCTRIDAANEGILVNQYGTGKGQGVTTTSGTVFYNPMTQDVYEYPVFVHTVDYEPFTVNAKDGSIFTVDPVLSYRIIRGRGADIFRKYRKDIDDLEQGVIRNYVKDAFKNIFNTYTTDNILSQRQKFDNEVTKLLSTELNIEGFEIDQLTFGMQYPQSITDAINAKNKAVQESQQAFNMLVRDSVEARRKIIQAEGEKRANELRQQSLTNLLIQQQFIEKWDGHTPLYGTNPITFKNVD